MIFTPKVLEQHIAILGKTGSGKTFTAKGIVEHLLRTGQRVCIIDPVAAWWGLRCSPDGGPGGFPVVIFGGRRGDVEIGASHGSAVAEVVASSSTSSIIDMKQMSVSARTQFFIDFTVTIMQKNEGVLHMVIDEAHLFAPKGRVNSNKAGEMLSETNNMVTGGRGIGLRFILLTQRPAKLHNDCLGSIETLVAQRLTLPADRDAVQAWMKDSADFSQGKQILESLPRLATGEGWVWSPEAEILTRTKFPMISTFDSSNPKNLRRGNVELFEMNLSDVKMRLEQAAGEIQNNDPVQLKRLLAKAKLDLAAAERKGAPPPPAPLDPFKDSAVIKAIADSYSEGERNGIAATTEAVRLALASMENHSAPGDAVRQAVSRRDPISISEAPRSQAAPRRVDPQPDTTEDMRSKGIKAGARRMLIAAARVYPSGLMEGAWRAQAGLRKGGTYDSYKSALRIAGYIEIGPDKIVRATKEGMAAAGVSEDSAPASYAEVREMWDPKLKAGARKMLDVIVNKKQVDRDTLATLCGLSRGGTFDSYLSSLRTAQLIHTNGLYVMPNKAALLLGAA